VRRNVRQHADVCPCFRVHSPRLVWRFGNGRTRGRHSTGDRGGNSHLGLFPLRPIPTKA
jgi:hypothetical protein